ncbi:MAG: GDSL-type esterase/lipase family protein, partial [Methylocystaceae bacterium]
YVIITGGANDVFWRESIPAILDNYRQMVNLAEKDNIKVIIGLTPPIDDPEMEVRLKRLRSELVNLAGEKQRTVIDFSPPFYRTDGSVESSLFLDGAHPNREGYQLMGKCLPPNI